MLNIQTVSKTARVIRCFLQNRILGTLTTFGKLLHHSDFRSYVLGNERGAYYLTVLQKHLSIQFWKQEGAGLLSSYVILSVLLCSLYQLCNLGAKLFSVSEPVGAAVAYSAPFALAHEASLYYGQPEDPPLPGRRPLPEAAAFNFSSPYR